MDVLRPPYRAARWLGRRSTSRWRCLPDYVIIGAQRSGTSTLARMLRRHPQVVWLAPAREVHWLDAHSNEGLAWYRAHFPFEARRRSRSHALGLRVLAGEKTPEYLLHPTAPRRAAVALPEARFLCVLRDPVERAISHYFMNLRYGVEPLSFEAALDAEDARCDATFEAVRKGERVHLGGAASYAYVRRGRYLEQLEQWWQHVPREQMHVLRAEDLYEQPDATFRAVCAFLGIEARAPFGAANESTGTNRRSMPAGTRARLAAAFEQPNRALADVTGITWLAGGEPIGS